MLTQKELKKYLHYNKKTGVFTWVKSASRNIKKGDIAGCVNDRGYWIITFKNKVYRAHRLAFLYMEGYFPENDIDHINRIKDDNRWNNLREVSRQCNIRNSKVYATNKSGVTGVNFSKQYKKWQVDITLNRSKQKFLGYFKDFDEAVAYRLAGEQCLNYPNCNSNSSAYLHMKEVICR